jgi:TIR domain
MSAPSRFSLEEFSAIISGAGVGPCMGTRQKAKRKHAATRADYAVFLSHSSRDLWLAGVIAERLRKAEIKVWLDEMSLQGGDTVNQAIIQGLRSAHEAIVLVSNESLRSQWVAAEIGMAMALSRRVTPLLNNVDPDAMAPLKGVKCYELNLFDKFLKELRARAKTKRGRASNV